MPDVVGFVRRTLGLRGNIVSPDEKIPLKLYVDTDFSKDKGGNKNEDKQTKTPAGQGKQAITISIVYRTAEQ